MDEPFLMEPSVPPGRKRVHIPIFDVDDLAFKNRHDPNFVANITKMMQVPGTITLNNESPMNNQRKYANTFIENGNIPMNIPDILTADEILNNRITDYNTSIGGGMPINNQHHSGENDHENDLMSGGENDLNNTTATPPSTPTKLNFMDTHLGNEEDKFSKTPQIAADLFNRMRPRRSSLEADLQQEIRILRDKISSLEQECQANSNSCKVFYAILCGYVLLKTFSWLLNK